MDNLSAPMRYALENSFVTDAGLYGFTSDVRTQTITGLITRGLAFRDDFDNTPYLNKTGEAVRSELLYPDQGDVNPETTPENVGDETDTTPEGDEPGEAVPGLEKFLDTPYVVPNRKDKRNRRRIFRAMSRLFAKKKDKQTKKRTNAAKAARKRGRKASV